MSTIHEAIQPEEMYDSNVTGVVSLGVTDDFAWYELSKMREQANSLASRMENMERVLRQRSKDQQELFYHLESKLKDARSELAQLRKE